MNRRIFGLDFSGAENAGRLIWLAEAERTAKGLRILSCKPASELDDSGMDRDRALAALGRFIAATPGAIFGCDFPFSLPRHLIRETNWPEFITRFDHANAAGFREHCRKLSPGAEPKRATDRDSKTPWCAFNIRLHHQTYHGLAGLLRPLVMQDKAVVLPMQKPRGGRAWIIETCPASLLIHLELRVPYKGLKLRDQRRRIVKKLVGLGLLSPLPADMEKIVLDNEGGDALDSIIAAIATSAALQEIENGRGGGDPIEGRVFFRA